VVTQLVPEESRVDPVGQEYFTVAFTVVVCGAVGAAGVEVAEKEALIV